VIDDEGPGGSTEPTRAAGRARVIHRVKPGDTLASIGRRYGVSVDAIRGLNGLKSDRIRAGSRLRIP
jgi:peptidoglycan endopeptidase LytE